MATDPELVAELKEKCIYSDSERQNRVIFFSATFWGLMMLEFFIPFIWALLTWSWVPLVLWVSLPYTYKWFKSIIARQHLYMTLEDL
jgi:hypothetical protein